MEETKVPWWRKALNFALSGIRSGFGLFPRVQKSYVEVEPEKEPANEEIREEAKLTEQFPEQDPILDPADPAQERAVSEAEESASPAVSEETAPTGDAEADRITAGSPEISAPAPVAEPAPESTLDGEPKEEAARLAEEPQVALEPEHNATVETVDTVEMEAASQPADSAASEPEGIHELGMENSIETTPEQNVDSVAEVPEVLAEPPIAEHAQAAELENVAVPEGPPQDASVVTIADPAEIVDDDLTPAREAEIKPTIEAAPAREESEVELEPTIQETAQESETTPVAVTAGDIAEQDEAHTETVVAELPLPQNSEILNEVQTAYQPAVEPAIESSAPEQLQQDEEPSDFALEDNPEVEELPIPELVEDAAIPAEENVAAIATRSEPDPVTENSAPVENPVMVDEVLEHADQSERIETPKSVEACESGTASSVAVADPVPSVIEPGDVVAGPLEAAPEPQEEQLPPTGNESVDEVRPEAEAAISESPAQEFASPVQHENVVPGAQAAIEPIDGFPEATVSRDTRNTIEENETAAQAEEHRPGEQAEVEEPIIEPVPAQESVIDEPMELNQPNTESTAEQKHAPDTASSEAPVTEPVAAPEANTTSPSSAAEAQSLPADAAVPAATPELVTHESFRAQHPSKPFIKLEPRDGAVNASPFSVIVSEVYDGPLDLLLDLIRKQDIDIYDIPIARITAQFLAYVDRLKATDVDVAGEFIYTASLLIHIKSKMLLPRAPSGPEDAAEDPRRELVERLLEHERFKNAAQMLQQKQMLEAATWTNPGVREFKEDAGAEPEIAADTVDLVRVFRDILDRARNRPVLNLQEDAVTVGQMIQFLSRRLTMEDKPVALRKLLSHTRSERALIAMFLALLELVRLQAILLRQDAAFSEIFIKKHSNFENVMTENTARDDWK